MQSFFRFQARKVNNEAIVEFSVHIWSPNEDVDYKLRSNFQEISESEYAEQIGRIVATYLPKQIVVKDLSIDYMGSVAITFALVWAGIVSLYELISKYDDFRNSLARIQSDLKQLFGRRLHRVNNIPIYIDINWHPTMLWMEIETEQSHREHFRSTFLSNYSFIWYLLVTNIILALALGALVFHAVLKVYFVP